MKACLLVCVMVVLLSAGALAADESSNAPSVIRFAVIPGFVSGGGAETDWLGVGISFDLEKRLERWSSLETTDRLRVHRAVKLAGDAGELGTCAVLFRDDKADAVIGFSGSCTPEELKLSVRVWTQNKTDPVTTFPLDGKPEDLFSVMDSMTDQVISALKTAFSSLGTPTPAEKESLHQPPSRSLTSYALMIHGMVAVQNGDSAAGRPLLEKALEIEPKSWWAHYFLGEADYRDGKFASAAKHCQQAIEIDPDLYPGVYANLAGCYQKLGDSSGEKWARGEFEARTTSPQRSQRDTEEE